MRILVCGSRSWSDPGPIHEVLMDHAVLAQELNVKLILIHGAAPGADSLAEKIANEIGGFEIIAEPADWKTYGKAAGPIRNQKMLDEHKPDCVHAFKISSKSNGTDDMIRRAKKAGIETYIH